MMRLFEEIAPAERLNPFAVDEQLFCLARIQQAILKQISCDDGEFHDPQTVLSMLQRIAKHMEKDKEALNTVYALVHGYLEENDFIDTVMEILPR
jgi:hypothetical protein